MMTDIFLVHYRCFLNLIMNSLMTILGEALGKLYWPHWKFDEFNKENVSICVSEKMDAPCISSLPLEARSTV